MADHLVLQNANDNNPSSHKPSPLLLLPDSIEAINEMIDFYTQEDFAIVAATCEEPSDSPQIPNESSATAITAQDEYPFPIHYTAITAQWQYVPVKIPPHLNKKQPPIDLPPRTTNVCDQSALAPLGVKKPRNGFRFKVKRAGQLSGAMQALNDSDLNPRGIALIELGNRGFKVTVHNPSTGVRGYLMLIDLEKLHYESPFKMLVSGFLDRTLQVLSKAQVNDDDAVTISHLNGSSYIIFHIGGTPGIVSSVELTEVRAEFENSPYRGRYGCNALIRVERLRQIIPNLVTPAIVDIMDKQVTFKFPNLHPPKEYSMDGYTTGVSPEQKHRSAFHFPHGNSLMTASFLTESQCFLIGFMETPPQTIMLRFNLKGIGGHLHFFQTPVQPIFYCLLD